MNLHDRLRWFGQVALVVFVLGAAAFLSGITAMRLAIRAGEVQVPSVAGMRAGDAQAALAARRLGLRIADRVYSDLPLDRVVRQSPPAGTHVKVSQHVHVVLSLGPRKLPIPPLEGKSLRAARIELLRAGLQVGEVSTCHLLAPYPAALAAQSPPGGNPPTPFGPTPAEGSQSSRDTELRSAGGIEGPQPEAETVVQQSPRPGEPAAARGESARVNLLVALAPEEVSYVMPDLRGLPLAEAQRRIGTAKLRLAKINAVPVLPAPSGREGPPASNPAAAGVPAAARGIVLRQKPAYGARLRASTPVELEVIE